MVVGSGVGVGEMLFAVFKEIKRLRELISL